VINISILQFFSFIIYLHVFYVGASVLTNFASLINEFWKLNESKNIYEKFKVKSVKSEEPKCVMYLQKL